MVAPLVEALLLRAVRRRPPAHPPRTPTRLVSHPQPSRASATSPTRPRSWSQRPGATSRCSPPAASSCPPCSARRADVRRPHPRAGRGLAADRTLRDAGRPRRAAGRAAPRRGRRHLVLAAARPRQRARRPRAGRPRGLGDALLDRVAREVSARTAEAVRRRTLAELTDLSLGVLLDGALPATFLDGLVERSGLEVVDVDWPTEGRGWPPPACRPRDGRRPPGLPPMTLVHGYVARHETEPERSRSPWPGRELGALRRTVRHAGTLPLGDAAGRPVAVRGGRRAAGDHGPARPGPGGWRSWAPCRCSTTPSIVGLLLLCSAALACWCAAGSGSAGPGSRCPPSSGRWWPSSS